MDFFNYLVNESNRDKIVEKQFLCIYCGLQLNRTCDSKEHVIPDYLFGKMIIREVCELCNHRVGEYVESVIPDYIRFAKFYKTGIIDKPAIAQLTNGSKIDGVATIIQQNTSEKNYNIHKFRSNDGSIIDISKIHGILLEAHDPSLRKDIAPAISKIAYSGLHYLLNYVYEPKRQYLDFVFCSELHNFRKMFDGTIINGNKKKVCKVVIHGQKHEVLYRKLISMDNPNVRRHEISIRQMGKNVEIELLLLSQELWKIKIHDFNIPVDYLHADTFLDELREFKPLHPSELRAETDQKRSIYVVND